MEVRKRGGFTADTLRRIVRQVSYERYEGNVIIDTISSDKLGRVERFKLRCEDSGYRRDPRGGTCAPGARRSSGGLGDLRRTVAACWHAHRDVLRAIFTVYPDAVIVTSLARYEGLKGFEATYPDTAYKNIGSMMCPAYMPGLCDCS